MFTENMVFDERLICLQHDTKHKTLNCYQINIT